MSSRLEQFIRDNREQFDSEEPNSEIFSKLQKQLQHPTKNNKITRINLIRLSVAAAIIVVAGLLTFFLITKKETPLSVAKTQQENTQDAASNMIEEIDPAYAKEVYHFTQIIELKQDELKKISNENPELYREFIYDINQLDSSYNALKKELPENPNREQLLEAMIQNLRLQADLLNQQLLIIQKIKQSKKDKNESNSKRI